MKEEFQEIIKNGKIEEMKKEMKKEINEKIEEIKHYAKNQLPNEGLGLVPTLSYPACRLGMALIAPLAEFRYNAGTLGL